MVWAMTRDRSFITAAVLVTLWAVGLLPVRPAHAEEPPLPRPAVAPIPGRVVTEFDAPAQDWLPGHRGVDLAGDPGERVVAAAAGEVTFVGVIDGTPMITVTHGEVRTTYQPVRALVDVGQHVDAGQAIGELEAGHANCPAEACLHWGLKQGDRYLDPTTLLGGVSGGTGDVRLLPEAAVATAERRADERRREPPPIHEGAPMPSAPGKLVPPANGPRTSEFGMRLHPVLGVWKLHDGLDFAAPCGAPIRAAADGVVRETYFNAGYGNRLMIDHVLDGRPVTTSYNHAIDYSVNPGDRVQAGQVVGRIGNTGYSTGCHLHFMVIIDGSPVDPAGWL